MTCVAWRNGVMACDSCWTDGDTQVASLIKITRLSSGALLGQAGDNDARAITALLDKIKDPSKLPSKKELAATLDGFMGLIAFPRGGVYYVSNGPVDEQGWPVEDSYGNRDDVGVWPATSMGGYCAVGSGSDLALAAMDGGPNVSAIRAVEIACRRNVNCRLPVHAVRLITKTKVVKRGGHK